jgi:hypothetical protein
MAPVSFGRLLFLFLRKEELRPQQPLVPAVSLPDLG